MSQTSPKSKAKDLILQQLRHPLKLRMVLCLTIIGAWYFSFFAPLGDETQITTATIARERKRIATAKEIEICGRCEFLARYNSAFPSSVHDVGVRAPLPSNSRTGFALPSTATR